MVDRFWRWLIEMFWGGGSHAEPEPAAKAAAKTPATKTAAKQPAPPGEVQT